MTEATKNGKKIQRVRRRIYETVEPVNIPEMSGEAAAILIEKPTIPSLEKDLDVVEQTAGTTAEPAIDKSAKALASVKHYALGAAGAGIVPLPLIDMLTMLALQMLMVRKLAKLYDVPYAKQRSKSAVAGLIGGFNAGGLGVGAFKMIPILGIFSYAVMPTINGAITYAVGKVFIQHFESGGTFLDFDPKKVRAYFEDQFREGKQQAL